MDACGAIVFLSQDGEGSSLFFQSILFDPAALWLAEDLRRSGLERFLVVCDDAYRDIAMACFPSGTAFVATDATDAPARLTDFLSQTPGPVTVVTRPVLLAPENVQLAPPSKALAKLADKAVLTLRGASLAAALKDGRPFEEALSALGDARPWQGRVLPLQNDLSYRALTVEPLAKRLGAERLLGGGVRILDAENVYVGPAASVGEGSVLLPGTILQGRTVVGRDCEIGPNTVIRDCRLGNRVRVNASQLNESTVDDDTTIGPFAYIRPGCHVGQAVKVGDFVELKNSVIGEGTKIPHLTYIGDTDAGSHINFGCGTVTVNYDGTQKYRTTVGDNAFIGCNTNLVAPVAVGDGAYTAAGSTITEDVPPDSLAIARDRQIVKKNWVKKRRKT